MTTSHCNLALNFSMAHRLNWKLSWGPIFSLLSTEKKIMSTKIGYVIVAIHMSVLSKPDLKKNPVLCRLILSFFKEIVFFFGCYPFFFQFHSFSNFLEFSLIIASRHEVLTNDLGKHFIQCDQHQNKTKQNQKTHLA